MAAPATEHHNNMIADVGDAAEALTADDGAPLHQIESLCMRCGENGMTRLLLTRIPHFREVVLMAFECPHCNERNNEVQFAGQLQPQGCAFTLTVPAGEPEVLNRQVVKSDVATIKVPELEFEVPPQSQRGTLSTIEGVLSKAVDELRTLQEERRKADPSIAEAIDAFLMKLNACAKGEQAFTFVIDDPSGNSYIENPYAPNSDPLLSTEYYDRTSEQQEALGFLAQSTSSTEPSEAIPEARAAASDHKRVKYAPAGTTRLPHGSVGAIAAHQAIAHGNSPEIAEALFKYSAPEEVMTFPSTCGACGVKAETRMFVTNIPYFKEVIVMASSCDVCGYKNSELKPGGRIPEKGKKIRLVIKSVRDLSRDVIKSDTASVEIPELELQLSPGTLGGLVTTVEGLLSNISESLKRVHGFSIGDSAEAWKKNRWQEFDSHLQKLLKVEEEFTLILDDALANSFIAPATDDFEADSQLSSEEYERTFEQNEDLGLNDMDTSAADVLCLF
uniref:Zinc finger ZPR1-type domain-containing protein n=1 Tax=Physcomitrium patens TaxID=3218 RepID=A0A7I4B749_PHYPA